MTDIELIERAVEEEAERILAANDRIWICRAAVPRR